MVTFYLQGSTVTQTDLVHEGELNTVLRINESSGSHVDFVVHASNAAVAIAIADGIRAAALKHLPAQEEVPA